MEKLTIVDEYRGHCEYVYIFPVRNIDKHSRRWTYEQNWDNIVGIPHYHVDGFLLESLNNHINPAIQFFGNPRGTYPDYFEEFGDNFYTKESVENVISDLKLYFHDVEKQNRRYLQLVDWENRRAKNRALNPTIVDPTEHLKAEIFFYRRLITRLNAILKSAVNYEYILFKGP